MLNLHWSRRLIVCAALTLVGLVGCAKPEGGNKETPATPPASGPKNATTEATKPNAETKPAPAETKADPDGKANDKASDGAD
jgi:hypothetical protein